MRSKRVGRVSLVVGVVFCMFSTACTQGPKSDTSENNIIGENMESVSSLTAEGGADQKKVALYDTTAKMIHVFDLNTSKYLLSRTPVVRSGEHKVLFDPGGNYVIDCTEKHISIINKNGDRLDPQLKFVGSPKNAAFRPSRGLLVIQDELKATGLVKLDSYGNVLARQMLGPKVIGEATLRAGDIDDQGRLIISLSDESMAIVDIDQTIAQGKWVLTSSFTTVLTEIDWIAAIHDAPNQVLVKSKGTSQIAIVNTLTGMLEGTPYTYNSSLRVAKTSKTYDPHIIFQASSAQRDSQATLVYAQGSQLRTNTTFAHVRNLLGSRLHLANNSWTLSDTNVTQMYISGRYYGSVLYDDPNAAKVGRIMKKYQVSDMLPLEEFRVPDGADIQMTETHIFELMPSKMGLAYNYDMATRIAHTIDKFNYPFVH
jgi:hypothetical protein